MANTTLRVERRGDALLLIFTYLKDGQPGSTLFALCTIVLSDGHELDYFVQRVGDSSRYFVVRVTDGKGEKEAVLGLGFKERDEAADFYQCVENFGNATHRERITKGAQMASQ